MLDRARARGESTPTLDELIELVLAPLYFYALFTRPAGWPDPRRLVDRLLTFSTSTAERGARSAAGLMSSESPPTARITLERNPIAAQTCGRE